MKAMGHGMRSQVARLACAVASAMVLPALAQAPAPITQARAPVKLTGLRDSDLARQQEFFPSSAPEPVHTGGCGVMEGIAAASDGRVFFTEITRSTGCNDSKGAQSGRIWVLEPGGKPRVFREPSGMAAGLAIDAQDRLVAAEGADFGGRRVSLTDLKTGDYRVIAYFYENRHSMRPMMWRSTAPAASSFPTFACSGRRTSSSASMPCTGLIRRVPTARGCGRSRASSATTER